MPTCNKGGYLNIDKSFIFISYKFLSIKVIISSSRNTTISLDFETKVAIISSPSSFEMKFRNDLENHFEAYSQDHPNWEEYFMRGWSAPFRYHTIPTICCSCRDALQFFFCYNIIKFTCCMRQRWIIRHIDSLTTSTLPSQQSQPLQRHESTPPAPMVPIHATGVKHRRRPSSARPSIRTSTAPSLTTTSPTVATAAVRESLAGGGWNGELQFILICIFLTSSYS